MGGSQHTDYQVSVGLGLSEDHRKGLQRKTGVDIDLLSQPSVDTVASSA